MAGVWCGREVEREQLSAPPPAAHCCHCMVWKLLHARGQRAAHLMRGCGEAVASVCSRRAASGEWPGRSGAATGGGEHERRRLVQGSSYAHFMCGEGDQLSAILAAQGRVITRIGRGGGFSISEKAGSCLGSWLIKATNTSDSDPTTSTATHPLNHTHPNCTYFAALPHPDLCGDLSCIDTGGYNTQCTGQNIIRVARQDGVQRCHGRR